MRSAMNSEYENVDTEGIMLKFNRAKEYQK